MVEAVLKDIVVLELANVLAGPSVGMFLAEAGASVIKIESINGGDVTRSWKLPSEDKGSDISAYFTAANWGKKAIALNLKTSEGKEIIYSLLQKADIVLTSYRPGDAEKLGVDYETLQLKKSDIIYAQLSGYGSNDPRAGYDAIIQAESGFMSINGTPDSGPVKMPVALMDILSAHQIKEAVLLALIKKFKTGEGSFIDCSLIKTGIASLANQATNWLNTGELPERLGSEHPNIMPYGNVFKTRDNKEIMLAVGTDEQFRRLIGILNISHIEKGQFSTNIERVQKRELLKEILATAILTFDLHPLLELLEKAAVPAGAVLNVKEVLNGKYGKSLLLNVNGYKGLRTVSFNLEHIYLAPPPHFGEHTEEILISLLQYSKKDIASLKENNIIN